MPTDIELKIGLSDSDKATMKTQISSDVLNEIVNGEVNVSGSKTNLTKLKASVDEAVGSIENKVEPDDICPELRAGYAFTADNLNATKGLTVSDDPMSSGAVGGAQKSAVGDGNASLNKLTCVDVVRNQLFSPDFVQFGSFTNGVYTANGTPTETSYVLMVKRDFIAGHKYLVVGLENSSMSTQATYFGEDNPFNASSSFEIINGTRILTAALSRNARMAILLNGGVEANISFAPIIVDLTQRYGSNEVVNAIIGSDSSKYVERLLAFDPEIANYTAYDAGTLVPSKSAKLLSVGVNQWDEEWEVGSINLSTGANEFGSKIRSKNFIKVLSSTTYSCNNTSGGYPVEVVCFYDVDKNYLGSYDDTPISFTTPANCAFIKFRTGSSYGTTYNDDICINISYPNIDGKYYPFKSTQVTLPNYEGHGVLKVVDGKVVADGDELYPDGKGKKRYGIVTLNGTESWTWDSLNSLAYTAVSGAIQVNTTTQFIKTTFNSNSAVNDESWADRSNVPSLGSYYGQPRLFFESSSLTSAADAKTYFTNNPTTVLYLLATEQDISTPVYQSTFPVEQGGTLQFLDENDKPIAGLQGSEIFYQKNIKAFVEALGDATDWNPERIKRLGSLSFTPEYVNIALNPSPTGAYARAQVYNATFTIVISAALTGTANGSITFQDSEVYLTNFQTKPADSIYDMDGKKVSEEPTTTDCNIASFVGRSKGGTVLWSLLHSGVNKVKIHIEDAVPLDSEGKGKIDCRASLIL